MTARRFELHQYARGYQLKDRGTVAVRDAVPYGFGDYFVTTSPCCGQAVRISAWHWAGIGKFITCRGCKWKWEVFLASEQGRLGRLDDYARHPDIPCDRAEWVSTGYATRLYSKRR